MADAKKPHPKRANSMRHRIAALEEIVSEVIKRRIYETRLQIIAELATERRPIED